MEVAEDGKISSAAYLRGMGSIEMYKGTGLKWYLVILTGERGVKGEKAKDHYKPILPRENTCKVQVESADTSNRFN